MPSPATSQTGPSPSLGGRAGAGQPLLRLIDVHKRFGRNEVLRGITFDVQAGEVVAILGPSGSGKSTLLRCINHLERIQGGQILFEGRLVGYRADGNGLKEEREAAIARMRREMGMVFQRFNLFPHLTALGNVMEAPVQVLKQPKTRAHETAVAMLTRVGLAAKLDAYPGQLSGGQQQRVAIARALANNPPLILADEPTGNLDSEAGRRVLEALTQIQREAGTTVVIVTHDADIARFADRTVTLIDGEVIPAPESVAAPAQAS